MQVRQVLLAIQPFFPLIPALTTPNAANIQQSPNGQCRLGNKRICSYSAICHVPESSVTLRLQGTGHFLRPFDMETILDQAQDAVNRKFFPEEPIKDRLLRPDELPFTITHNGLQLRAQRSGWSWVLLNLTINGVRECAIRKGIFQEIYINSIEDPRALSPYGPRFFNIVQRSKPSPPPAAAAANALVTAPRPFPPGLDSCVDPDTKLRLLFELGDPIGRGAMIDVLDGAEQDAQEAIRSSGDADAYLRPEDRPWASKSVEGLVVKAQFDGWTFGFLLEAIRAMRYCVLRKGSYREVLVYDVEGPGAPLGQRYLDLRKVGR
ncbi:MAG: hypothetical protein Q9184_000671 [Pyrenodesmia sp. 2 TL-2023]